MTTDNYIIGITATIFILAGIMLPFINDAFDTNSVVINTQGLETTVGESSPSDTSLVGVVTSVFLMFFWTFGALPFWLDAVFLIFRVMFAVALFGKLRG